MSATTHKQATVATREAEPSILDQILDQVQTISVQQSRPSPIHLRTFDEVERYAERAANSGMVPKDYAGKPGAICIAVMMGAELGLPPAQSLINIAIINGRPSLFGDAIPGLIRSSGKCAYMKEWSEGDGDKLTWFFEAKRKDDPNVIRQSFSVADAKKAGLWGKSGPWVQYPGRMVQMRCRGFGARDAFPDVLKGLLSAEEAADIPFEATGLTPRVEPERKPEMPAKPNGATETPEQREAKQRAWMDKLELDLAHAVAEGGDAVDSILARPDVVAAQDRARGAARDRLSGMIAEAIAKSAATETSAPNDATETEPLFANPADDPFAERVPV